MGLGTADEIKSVAMKNKDAATKEAVSRDEWFGAVDIAVASSLFDVNILVYDGQKWTVYNADILRKRTVSRNYLLNA